MYKFLSVTIFLLLLVSKTKAQPVNYKYDRVGSFKEGLAPVYLGNKVGYIDKSGKEVIPVIYEEDYTSDDFIDGVAIVSINKKMGLIDKTGKLIVPCEYKSIGTFSEGLAEAFKENGKVGFINTKGEAVIPFNYTINVMYGGAKCINGMMPVENSAGRNGYIDKTNKLVVPFIYEVVNNFSDGVAMVKSKYNGKVSYLNTKGETVIAEKYDDGTMFIDGLAYVNVGAKEKTLYAGLSGGKWGVIDKTGKEIIPVAYDKIYEIKNGLTIVAMGKYPNEKKGLVGKDGKIILPVEYYDIKILKDRVVANKVFTGPFALFNYSGKQLGDFSLHLFDIFPDYTEGLLRVQEVNNNKLGKVGAIDANGILKIPFTYDYISQFYEGLAIVSVDNKFGAIDKTGKTVIPIQYEEMTLFSEGWAGVKKNGKWGFISKTDKLPELTKITAQPTATEKKPEPIKTANGNVTTPVFLLEENFDNNNNKWTVWNVGESAAEVSNSNYKFAAKENKNILSWLGTPVVAAAQAAEFAIETKITSYKTEQVNPNDSYWLMWGIGNGGKDYYAFGIYPEGKFQYGKNIANVWSAMPGSLSSEAIKKGNNQTNIIKVEKKQGDILFFINGVQVHKAKYESFNTAYTGLGFQVNNKQLIDIDYINVYKINTGTTAKKEDSKLIPNAKLTARLFDPYETNYENALNNAKGSNERKQILTTYMDALYLSKLSIEEKTELTKNKIEQLRDIDFYALYQYYLYVAKDKNIENAKLFYGVILKTLTEQQRSTFTEYMKYAVSSSEALVYSQTSGKTEQLAKPANWPAGAPLPGYGWGKTISSDNAVTSIAVQYHLSVEERYAAISKNLKEGKTVAEDDIKWAIQYEAKNPKAYVTNTNTQNPNNNNAKNDDNLLKMLVGKMYNYENALPLSKTSCQVTGYKNKDEIYITCNNNDKRTVTYDELVNNKAIFGYKVNNTVYTCKVCKGNGTVKSTFSHTNDYEYTLGKKTTYTTTTTSKCNACGGSGYTYQ